VADLHVFDSPDDLAKAAAHAIAERAASVQSRGRDFRLALSGGRTPAGAYSILGRGRTEPAVDWNRVIVLFADERAAPPTEPESNYWEARKLLLEPAGVPPRHVHRMKAENPDLEAAAAEYEPLLAEPLDLLVLGIGEDGHTASLFPGSSLVRERRRRAAAVFDSPKPPPRRLTITPRVIVEARSLLMLASGAGKAAAVARALAPDADPATTPAALARAGVWLIDTAAAAESKRTRA
jgi:6-phosphogluconolactonase